MQRRITKIKQRRSANAAQFGAKEGRRRIAPSSIVVFPPPLHYAIHAKRPTHTAHDKEKDASTVVFTIKAGW